MKRTPIKEKNKDRKKTLRGKVSHKKPVESPDGPSITAAAAALGIDGPRRRPRRFPLPVARGGLPRERGFQWMRKKYYKIVSIIKNKLYIARTHHHQLLLPQSI